MSFWSVLLACWLAMCIRNITGLLLEKLRDFRCMRDDEQSRKTGFGNDGARKKKSEYSPAEGQATIGFKMQCDYKEEK